MTQVGGLVPLQVSPDVDKFTRLIMEVQLGHVFKTHIHELKNFFHQGHGNTQAETVR